MRFPRHSCWSLGYYVFVLWLTAVCLPVVLAKNQTVSSSDSLIHYSSSDDWLDQDNGGYKVSARDFASASFTFTGSAVYFLSSVNWNGAVAAITIDGDSSVSIDQSQGTQKDAPIVPSTVLYSRDGLDGTKSHTIQVSWTGKGIYGGGYLSIYGFIYDDAPSVATIPAAGSSSSVTAPQTSSSTNNAPATTTSSKIGISTTSDLSSSPSTGTTSITNSTVGNTSTNNANTISHSFTPSPAGTSNNGLTITTISSSIISISVTAFQSGSDMSAPTVTAASSPSPKTTVIVGAVGGAIGGILLGILLVFCVFWTRKRCLSSNELQDTKRVPLSPAVDIEVTMAGGRFNSMPMMSQAPVQNAHFEHQLSTDDQLPSGSRAGKTAAAARARLLAMRNMDARPTSPSSSGTFSPVLPVFIAGYQSHSTTPHPQFRPLSDIAPPVYTERPS